MRLGRPCTRRCPLFLVCASSAHDLPADAFSLVCSWERAGGSSSEQQSELERIASEVEARVLAQRTLSAAAMAERDAELVDATVYCR